MLHVYQSGNLDPPTVAQPAQYASVMWKECKKKPCKKTSTIVSYDLQAMFIWADCQENVGKSYMVYWVW